MNKCLQCDSNIDVAVGAGSNPQGYAPKAGDWIICVRCGQIGTLTGEYDIVPASKKKMNWLMYHHPDQYLEMTRASVHYNGIFEKKTCIMKKIYIDAHRAIHDPKQKRLKINGTPTEIQTKPDGLRFIIVKDEGKEFEVVQQNPKTQSTYALRAREGEKISWIIPLYFGTRKSDGWKVITDSTPVEA